MMWQVSIIFSIRNTARPDMGPAVAATDVNAADLGPILAGAIHDYDSSTDTYTVVRKLAP